MILMTRHCGSFPIVSLAFFCASGRGACAMTSDESRFVHGLMFFTCDGLTSGAASLACPLPALVCSTWVSRCVLARPLLRFVVRIVTGYPAMIFPTEMSPSSQDEEGWSGARVQGADHPLRAPMKAAELRFYREN